MQELHNKKVFHRRPNEENKLLNKETFFSKTYQKRAEETDLGTKKYYFFISQNKYGTKSTCGLLTVCRNQNCASLCTNIFIVSEEM